MNRLKRSSKAIVLLLSLLVLLFMVLDINQSYENAYLLAILNTLFLGIIPIFVAATFVYTYLKNGDVRALLMSCSMFVLGVGSIVAGWARFLPDSANYTVTTHNISAFLGSILNLLAATAERPNQKLDLPRFRKANVALCFVGIVLFVCAVVLSSVKGIIPAFFAAQGSTDIRNTILWLTIAFYFGSSVAFYKQYAKTKMEYLYWYAASLLLITTGLFGVCVQKVVGSPLCWAGRVSQYVGCLFALMAIVVIVQRAKEKSVAAAEIMAEFFMDAESNYRDLVEHMPHAIILAGEGFKVLFSNPAARELFQYEDMQGQPFLDSMIAETSREQLRRCVEAAVAASTGWRNGEALNLEGMDKTGRIFPIEFTMSVSRFSAGNVITFVVQDVTERRRAEEALKQSEEQLCDILDSIQDGFFELDRAYRYTYINSKAAINGKLEPKQYIGNCIWDLFPYSRGTQYEMMYRKVMETREPAHFDIASSSYGLYYDINVYPSASGISVFWTDITERKQLEENLKNQNNLLESIVKSMIYGITLRDKQGDMILSNDLVLKLLSPIGINNNAWEIEYERYFTDLDGNPIPQKSGPMIRALGGEAVNDFRMVLEDLEAGERILEVSAVPIFRNGELEMAVSFTHDITDLIMSQRALAKQERLLLQAEKERNMLLRQTIGMKDEFLLTITHEFKTPLSVINSALQTIEMVCARDLTDRIKKYHNIIRQNSNRQLRLVNNLLDVTRMDAGRLTAELRNADIVAQTRSIVDSIAVFAEQKGLKLSFTSSLESRTISTDIEKYERILLNLLSNAVKFTPPGQSVAVILTQRAVGGKKKVCIEVRDTGIGIPADKKDLIFEKFGQAGSPRAKQAEGTGIGLHLVKQLAELLGGVVSLESELGQGSAFTVLLPDEMAKEPIDYQITPADRDGRLVQASALEFSDVYLK